MKIQINSLQALERLIGNDNEVEIEIRNSIVQEFSKKYLKNIAVNFEEKIKNFVKETKDSFEKELLKGSSYIGDSCARELKRNIREFINKIAQEEIQRQEYRLRQDWVKSQKTIIDEILKIEFNRDFIRQEVEIALREKARFFIEGNNGTHTADK